MIVYYDIVSGKEIGSDAFDELIPVAGIKSIVSTKIVIKEGEIDIGANASAEAEEDESFDDSESRSVINVVEAGHLQKMELSKKELKTLTQSYWKTLLKELTRQKLDHLGFAEDYKAPEDKAAAKADEEKALGELKGYALTKYNEVANKLVSFRKNFDAIQKWFTDDVLANYEEYEFYTCEEGELGKCMIIPARYIGEATAPVFFFYTDGIREKKE